jgi:hypothetical protein
MVAVVMLLLMRQESCQAYFADWSLLARDRQPTCVDIPANMSLCHNIGQFLSRILHIRLYIFRLFSEYTDRMENTQKRNFYFQQCLTKLKESIMRKSNGGIINWPTMNQLQN